MFWSLYILSSIVISLCISRIFNKGALRITVFFFLLVLLITPSRIEIQYESLGPAVFLFLFDLIFEGNIFNMKLRPLAITLPLVLFISGMTIFLKKRFF